MIAEKQKAVGKFLKTKEVSELIKNYKQERWVHNTERIGKEDSLSLWWSIDEVEGFIEKAKMHQADGLKFYFAAYGSENIENPEFTNRQTLVMVATKENTTSSGIANKDLYLNTNTGSEILAYNRGHLCPPFCNPKPNTIDDDSLEIGITLIDKGDDGLLVI